jgi:ATP-dependent Clp protease ATP-binding subunit ClpB
MSKNSRLLVTTETDFGKEMRTAMSGRLINQPAAIDYFVGLLEKYTSTLYNTERPIGSVLFTGPSGAGKTYAAETFTEAFQPGVLKDWRKKLLKIDCAEFQHSHEIAKLIGSPPGYLGHRETKPMLAGDRIRTLQGLIQQKNANGIPTDVWDCPADNKYPVAVILWDEVEKASDALWQLLLGILDHGTISTGANESVDLRSTIHILTSNTGFSDGKGGLGFIDTKDLTNSEDTVRRGVESAKRKFSVEFINRLDGIVGFPALTRDDVARVLKLELGKLQMELFTKGSTHLIFNVTGRAQRAMLDEGYDPKYNAREIRRTIDRHMRLPLARILASKQVLPTEIIYIDYRDGAYVFEAVPSRGVQGDFVIHGSTEDMKTLDKGDNDIL